MKDHIVHFFSGSGIGLLIGVLLGLAVSPVVGVIIGALASCLALILGLNEKHLDAKKSLRIGAFGIACVTGVFFGMFVRSHNFLAPSLETLKTEYMGLGYTQQQALDFIAYKEFGILNHQWRMAAQGEGSQDDVTLKQRRNVLYSNDIFFTTCEDLKKIRDTLPPQEIVNGFELAGGSWKRSAAALKGQLSQEQSASVLLLARDAFCNDPDDREGS